MKFICNNLFHKHLLLVKKLFILKYFMISYKFKTSVVHIAQMDIWFYFVDIKNT